MMQLESLYSLTSSVLVSILRGERESLDNFQSWKAKTWKELEKFKQWPQLQSKMWHKHWNQVNNHFLLFLAFSKIEKQAQLDKSWAGGGQVAEGQNNRSKETSGCFSFSAVHPKLSKEHPKADQIHTGISAVIPFPSTELDGSSGHSPEKVSAGSTYLTCVIEVYPESKGPQEKPAHLSHLWLHSLETRGTSCLGRIG